MSYIKGKISPRPENKRNGKSRKSRKDARVTLYPVPAVTLFSCPQKIRGFKQK